MRQRPTWATLEGLIAGYSFTDFVPTVVYAINLIFNLTFISSPASESWPIVTGIVVEVNMKKRSEIVVVIHLLTPTLSLASNQLVLISQDPSP